jgi:hypothetical protein
MLDRFQDRTEQTLAIAIGHRYLLILWLFLGPQGHFVENRPSGQVVSCATILPIAGTVKVISDQSDGSSHSMSPPEDWTIVHSLAKILMKGRHRPIRIHCYHN